MRRTALALALAATAVTAAATEQLAIRVDLEALAPAAELARVAIVVQIAPEDRPRLGRRATVIAELSSSGSVADRSHQDVALDGNGQIRLERTLPPGVYQLLVTVRGRDTDASGLWTGEVTIPALPPSPLPEPAAAIEAPETTEEPEAPTHPVPRETPPPTAPPRPASPAATSEPNRAQLTFFASRQDTPLTDIANADLQLRIDGKEVPVLSCGEASTAPLLLGLALDLSRYSQTVAPDIGRALIDLVSHTDDVRFFVLATDAEPRLVLDWRSTTSALVEATAEAVSQRRAGTLPDLVDSALGRFQGLDGRRALILVTDGRGETTNAPWREAERAARAAGVPLLVIAVWTEPFEQRSRTQLRELARISGGRVFFVQGTDELSMIAERYARMLASSRLVCFQTTNRPGKLLDVDLKPAEGSIELSYPQSLR